MSDSDKDSAAKPNEGAPEPHDTTTTTKASEMAKASGVVDQEAVDKQREAEAKDAAKAEKDAAAETKVPAADKRAQTKAAKQVREEAAADAETRTGDAPALGLSRPESDATSGNSDVDKQRAEYLDAQRSREFGEAPDVEGDDAVLAAAAPGGQTTAAAGSKEGSTVVSQTAASPAPAGPLSGPLDAPQAGVLRRGTSEDDPDNRVYADAAGPRDVFEDLDDPKARYIDADGNEVDYDAMFEDDGKSFVTTKMRVYETFIFPNTVVEGRRLAYAQGKRVPRGEAENVKRQISQHARIV